MSKTLEKLQNYLPKNDIYTGMSDISSDKIVAFKNACTKTNRCDCFLPVIWDGTVFRESTVSRHPLRIKYMENQDAPQALKPSHHAGPQEYITSEKEEVNLSKGLEKGVLITTPCQKKWHAIKKSN